MNVSIRSATYKLAVRIQKFSSPALKSLAPTKSETRFAIAQGIVLVLFVVLGTAAAKRFRLEPLAMAATTR